MTLADQAPTNRAVLLDVGHVVTETLRTIASQAAPLGLLAFVFVFLPQVVAGFAPADMKSVGNLANLPALIFYGGGSLIAYRALTGGAPVGFGEAASAGASRFGTLFGVGLICGIAEAIGIILLVVPGLFLIVAWMPTTAVVMVENLKTNEALNRAWALTKGARWRLAALFGIMVGVFIALIVLMLLAGALVGVLSSAGDAEHNADLAGDFVGGPLLVSIVALLSVVGATTVYVELRRLKEGGVESELAQVFAEPYSSRTVACSSMSAAEPPTRRS